MKTYFIALIITIVTTLISAYAAGAWAEEINSSLNGEKLYGWYCTSCHGKSGNGKGSNAKNLDPRPANHTDPELMGRRSNKDLSDAVSGGGKMIGKATLMPPWGEVFSKTQIESLVIYMRTLCRCTE